MSCPHVESASVSKPNTGQFVYREDCTRCFDSRDDPDGLDVCLTCFNGGCAGDRHHGYIHYLHQNHPLTLNIRRTRKLVLRDEPPAKISKLAIAAETEEDRYDTALTIKCHACALNEIDVKTPSLAPVVEGIMTANTFSRQEEVKAWEQELTSCEHILTLQQGEARKMDSQHLGHCSQCELTENLWICLECGALGCGRMQFGGVGGNSHALAHANERQHGVAVKLGSITPDGTADVYCYACDEERVDEELGPHLANWGIILAEMQKTEKSLTEMQIEQNLRWEFSMTTEDGKELTPLFGPGLTGLKNLGNSCYLASILQCLFDTPAFADRYGSLASDLLTVADPAADVETQLRKIGDGLLSGRYSKPDSDVFVSEYSPEVPHQKGLAPAMFKHLIGRGHAEFSTMRQQDAFELLQHLVKIVTRSKHPTPEADPTRSMRFTMEHRLQCRGCGRVRYRSQEQDSILIQVPLRKLPAEEGEQAKYEAVSLKQCLDNLTAEEVVELTCTCGSKDGFTKRQLFQTFPDILVVNANKMTVVNWVPIKVDVPVMVEEEPFELDEYASWGRQPDEEEVPEEETPGAVPSFVPDSKALAMLLAMGFPSPRCEKALQATGNTDANTAMEWLFAHMEDPDIDAPLHLGGEGGSGGGGGGGGSDSSDLDLDKIEMLAAMGFSGPKARKALKETSGNMERAVEWLFSHPDDEGEAADALKAEAKPVGSSELPARFQLQSIVCHKGTSIHSGHYVAFIRKKLCAATSWVLFNDEKVVKVDDVDEMKKFAYVYFLKRV